MTDFTQLLATLRRPRLLMRAARFGLQDYRRDRDLRRLIGGTDGTPQQQVLHRLLDEEEKLELSRSAGDHAYPVARHIEILAALLGEARLLPKGT